MAYSKCYDSRRDAAKQYREKLRGADLSGLLKIIAGRRV